MRRKHTLEPEERLPHVHGYSDDQYMHPMSPPVRVSSTSTTPSASNAPTRNPSLESCDDWDHMSLPVSPVLSQCPQQENYHPHHQQHDAQQELRSQETDCMFDIEM